MDNVQRRIEPLNELNFSLQNVAPDFGEISLNIGKKVSRKLKFFVAAGEPVFQIGGRANI